MTDDYQTTKVAGELIAERERIANFLGDLAQATGVGKRQYVLGFTSPIMANVAGVHIDRERWFYAVEGVLDQIDNTLENLGVKPPPIVLDRAGSRPKGNGGSE